MGAPRFLCAPALPPAVACASLDLACISCAPLPSGLPAPIPLRFLESRRLSEKAMSARCGPLNSDDDLGPGAGLPPRHPFTWIVDDKVIAMGRPGPADLDALSSLGVTHVISLTLLPLPGEQLDAAGITGIQIPVVDMAPPSVEEISHFVRELSELVDGGNKVAVHCGAGLGRTGTMIACYLVSTGMPAEEALGEIRRRRPGSVESRAQEEAVRNYEEHLRP